LFRIPIFENAKKASQVFPVGGRRIGETNKPLAQ